jgi:predicted dehydrogenase
MSKRWSLDDIVKLDLKPACLREPIPENLRIVLVGAGRIVHSGVMPAYRSVGIQPVAAADPDPAAREAMRRIWGITNTFDDFESMFDAVEFDAVDINMGWEFGMSETRVEAVRRAAAAGKHVIVAKPFAETWCQCVEMVELAERGGVVLAIDQNTRFAPTFYGCRTLIHSGVLGELISGSINYHSGLGRQHTNAFHAVQDVCVHGVDVLLSWFEEEPEEVFSHWSRRVDGVGSVIAATLVFKGGRNATLLYDFASRHRRQFECIAVGDEASADGLQDQELPPPSRMLRSTLRVGPHEPRGLALELPLQHTMSPESYLATRADFLQSIVADRLPWVNGRTYLRTMRVLYSIVAATRAGQAGALVRLDDFDPADVEVL